MFADQFEIRDEAVCNVVRNRKLQDLLSFVNPVLAHHYREGKYLASYETYNDITNEGKNDILGVYFHSDTQTATGSWYIGLVSAASFSGFVSTDVMNSHSGWTEFTSYSQSTRVAWGPGASSGQSITNATAAQFDITGTGSVHGVFITTNSTKGGTTGKLWATAAFASDVSVVNGDQIKISYTVSA